NSAIAATAQASFLETWRLLFHSVSRRTARPAQASSPMGHAGIRRIEKGETKETFLAFVVTVMIEVCVPVVATATLVGFRVQVDSAGAPVQVRATLPVNPPCELSEAVNVPLLPAVTVTEAGAAPSVKSAPATLFESEIVCGLLGSLSPTLRVADSNVE